MTDAARDSSESIAVLFQSGRRPEWDRLPQSERRVIEQEHVDLMLSVAQDYGMQQMQGFRLVMPQHTWKLFWVIEFPILAGAEAWIHAEVAPRFGDYGFHQYHLARRARTCVGTAQRDTRRAASRHTDPHQIPELRMDHSSVVALAFVRHLPAAGDLERDPEGEQSRLIETVVREHSLLRHEEYALITPQRAWRQVWLTEFPTLDGIEAWIEGQSRPPRGSYLQVDYWLARRWAPEYVASWIPRQASKED
jgi:hypothetical protein